MTPIRQLEANRRNALESTGPTTDQGKQRSRRNAVRHGLAAETVIRDLEDAEDYTAFELAVTSGFDAPTAVERELVLRLASLLWRLRRATAIETGLLQLQHDILTALHAKRHARTTIEQDTDRTPGCGDPTEFHRLRIQSINTVNAPFHSANNTERDNRSDADEARAVGDDTNTDLARCFLRLANLDNCAFERTNRYETALWRQVGQVLLMLDFLRRNR